MLKERLKVKWTELGEKIRAWQDRLSEAQLRLDNGQREKFAGILQKRYGYSQEKALSELNEHYSKIRLT